MWIKTLTVVNVGPFDKLELDLTRGSIGVFGRNGRGKSTILNLLYALITNDFGRFYGVKTDMIRNTADPKAESYISGQVEHNGVVLDITRNFRVTKTKPGTVLKVNGEQITDANKAQARIYELLGVDGKMLDLYVFKEQDKIYDFLTSVPSERAKAYQVLCRTEKCEKLWDMLGTFLNKDKEINTEIVDNSDELTGEISELEQEHAKLVSQRETAAEKLCKDENRERFERIVKDADRRETLLEEKSTVDEEIKALEPQLKKRQTTLDEAETALAEAKERYDKRKDKAEETRAALKAWNSYRTYRKQRKALNEERDSLVTEGEALVPPEPPADVDKLEVGKKRLARAEAELEEAKATLAVFEKTGMTACPTCKTPTDHLTGHLEELKKKVKELPVEIDRLEKKIEAIELYQSKARKYEKELAAYKARKAANEKALEALKEVTAPDGTEEELKEWLERFERTKTKYEEAERAAKEAEKARNWSKTKLSQRKSRLTEIAQKLEELDIDPSKLEKAKRRLAEHLTATNEISSLNGEIKGVDKQIQGKKDDLKKLKTKLKRSKRLKQMAKVIEAAREVLHRDRLPKRVAQMNLSRMEGDINEQLGFFGDPYWVEADNELSFVVHKSGEPAQNAGRLSTGQRVILALAFWPSVASLWSSELGMLALDEPTANLDGENRKLLRDALGAMTAKVRGQRQLIMVTHDPDLRTSFDQVIDLGG
jgi:DNA repair exonuclease SbcCD ATPase subunit